MTSVTRILIIAGLTLSQVSAAAEAPVSGAPSVSLEKAFDAALEKTETFAIQRTVRNQAEERVSQAGGSILPQLNLNGSYTRQDTSSSTNAFTAPDQSTVRLTLSQPLFRGFAEYAGLRATKASLRSEEALTEQSKLNVFSSVSQAYFEVLSAEQDAEDLRTLKSLSEKRVAELKQRTKIGRSRTGELYLAEAQVASADAQLEAALSRIRQGRDLFALVTALPRDTRLEDTVALPARLAPLPDYLARVEHRPDLQARRELVTVSEEQVGMAKGGHWPTLDFAGNYYLRRTGILADTKWDVQLSATFPIFHGGVTQSQVREAAEREKGSELALSQSRRTAEREIATSYTAAATGLDQIGSLKRSAELQTRNYESQLRDYRLGLVTNLDVVAALNSFIDARRSLDRMTFQTKQAVLALRTVTGDLPVSSASGASR